MELIRSLKPNVKIVVGGYDPSLAFEAYLSMPVDFIVRGEGEVTFRELTRALDNGCRQPGAKRGITATLDELRQLHLELA